MRFLPHIPRPFSVGNIPYEATEEQLREHFSRVGEVISFRWLCGEIDSWEAIEKKVIVLVSKTNHVHTLGWWLTRRRVSPRALVSANTKQVSLNLYTYSKSDLILLSHPHSYLNIFSLSYRNICTLIHIQIYTHVCIHTCTHAVMHWRMHTYMFHRYPYINAQLYTLSLAWLN